MGGLHFFWLRSAKRSATERNPRLRILLWATLVSLIFGLIEFGQPLEDYLRVGRNMIRKHDASGSIVVVAIDDRSLGELSEWPWPRRHHAQLADRLQQLGARKIFFDIEFSSRNDADDDKLLEATLARLGRMVTLPVRLTIDPVTDERVDHLPLPAFRKHVELAHINVRYNYQGRVLELPYALDFQGRAYPSFAAALAGVSGASGSSFDIDYAIDPRSVPSVSAVDVIAGKISRDTIAGKDVVIGTTSLQLEDIYHLPGYTRMGGVYLHALGAETLKAGRPTSVGWFLPYIAALLIAAGCIFTRSTRVLSGLVAGGIAAFLLVPLILDAYLITIKVVPAIFLLSVIGGALAWSRFRASYRVRGTTNTVSGLPNLNALREETLEHDRLLIAARIRNYAEIASALPASEEKALVDQIAGRLTLGGADRKLYQGDEGIFAWFAETESAASMGDHLDALCALFKSPVIVAGNPVDLAISFGLDAGSERSLANRLGSALVAADEAANEGVRWKSYDPAKLKDAAWKLSLLSQLDAAIEAGDVWIAFQPKLDLATRRIVGAEALVRWTHPEKGPIGPMEFVLAAEQHNRIEKLTDFVLDGAIRAAAAINARGIDFEVSVNLSARLIDSDAVTATVTDLLSRHRLAPRRLTLEVTETAALTNSGSDLKTLHDLRRMGVQISIDDYGTGLSTLDYLKKIPATEIKIDKSFVQAIGKSKSDRLMVHSTIQLAHSLDQKVVAEGVEDDATLDALVGMGCDIAQGYLISRPVPLSALMRQLLADRHNAAAYAG